ncbi:MAG TPA: hypothetical protein DDZ89_04330 [Clostridiales bacterium]|nr:hypothetical protein [Clostridiales bacterium]
MKKLICIILTVTVALVYCSCLREWEDNPELITTVTEIGTKINSTDRSKSSRRFLSNHMDDTIE